MARAVCFLSFSLSPDAFKVSKSSNLSFLLYALSGWAAFQIWFDTYHVSPLKRVERQGDAWYVFLSQWVQKKIIRFHVLSFSGRPQNLQVTLLLRSPLSDLKMRKHSVLCSVCSNELKITKPRSMVFCLNESKKKILVNNVFCFSGRLQIILTTGEWSVQLRYSNLDSYSSWSLCSTMFKILTTSMHIFPVSTTQKNVRQVLCSLFLWTTLK